MADEPQGQGTATSEIEELRERIVQLEGAARQSATEVPPRVVQRMVPLWGGGPLVPYVGEDIGSRLVQNEFANIDREAFLADPAVAAIRNEIVADVALREPRPEPSALPQLQRSEIDTRTGEPSAGPIADVATHKIVDRIAAGFEKLERAELEARYRKALGSDTSDDTDG